MSRVRRRPAGGITRHVRGMMALEGEGRPAPGAGQATVQILGTLTLRGGTRPTTQPRVMRVLSIGDPIRLPVDRTSPPVS